MKVVRRYRRMPDISEARAKRILAPYLDLLAESIERAWARWWELPGWAILAADSRSRAAMVYSFICEEVKARFESVPGISIHKEPYDMLWLNVRGVLVIRFKKLDETKRGHNIPTNFQRDFTWQRELPHLPRRAPRLVVGYQLDTSQTRITDILVTFPVGDVVKWDFSAREEYSAGVPISIPLPFPAAPTTRKARITAKNPDKAAKKLSEQIREVEEAEQAATEVEKESSDR